jgi:hypothetical protein
MQREWLDSMSGSSRRVAAPGPARDGKRASVPPALFYFLGDKMTEDQPTIGATIRAAFKLSAEAAALRDALAKQLPRCVGRDHAVAHRAYTTLRDMVVGFDQLSDKIAECVAINRYLA